MPTDIINFLMLSDEERGSKAEQMLGDLREQAQALARRTGQEPMTFREFTTLHQYDLSRNSSSNVIPGGLIGGAALAGIGLLLRSRDMAMTLGLSGLVLGGAIGAFWNTSNDARYKAIGGYAEYLGDFARAHLLHSRPQTHVTAPTHEAALSAPKELGPRTNP